MYRTIDGCFWTDLKVRSLKTNDKLIFLYLITGPLATISGVYCLPLHMIAHGIGLGMARVRAGIKALIAAGMIDFDETLSVVWVRNMLKHQTHGGKLSPKLAAAVASDLGKVRDSPLVPKFLEHYAASRIPYPIGYLIPSALSDTDTERETETDTERETVAVPATPIAAGAATKPLNSDGELPLVIPAEIDTPEFRLAWEDWRRHRKEIKKKLTPLAVEKQVKLLAGLGAARAIAAIEHSIANGYTGIIEPKPTSRTQPPASETDIAAWIARSMPKEPK